MCPPYRRCVCCGATIAILCVVRLGPYERRYSTYISSKKRFSDRIAMEKWCRYRVSRQMLNERAPRTVTKFSLAPLTASGQPRSNTFTQEAEIQLYAVCVYFSNAHIQAAWYCSALRYC